METAGASSTAMRLRGGTTRMVPSPASARPSGTTTRPSTTWKVTSAQSERSSAISQICRALFSSSTLAKRLSACFSRQHITTCSRHLGTLTSGAAMAKGGAISSKLAIRTFMAGPLSNGGLPVIERYISTPSAQMSTRWSIASSRICSGAMYMGVPST